MLAMSIVLGFLSENWFLEFGLAVVVISALASMTMAFIAGRKAAKAEMVVYESFLPEVDNRESHFFKFSAGMMGLNSKNPGKHFQDQIDELRRASVQDEKTFRSLIKFTNRRVDISLAQLRYHEESTLPKILGQGSSTIFVAGILSIIGSIYLAVPLGAYQAFSTAAALIRAVVPGL